MRVLLTGANGHLGANTARALLEHGHEVRAFVRPSADLRGLAGLELTLVAGDVLDKASLIKAAKGCEAIIHSAAVFTYWAQDPVLMLRTSVQGVRHVFAAAIHNGVQKIVYTGSSYALGFVDVPDKRLNGNSWNQNPHTSYAQAKVLGEREALQQSEETGVPLVRLIPGGLLGPHDFKITPATAWIKAMVGGWLPTIEIGANFIDVRDAAEVHVRAIEDGEPGIRYLLGGENLAYRELALAVARTTGGKNPVHLPLGRRTVTVLAGLFEAAATLTGRTPIITRAFVREAVGRYQYFESTKTNETFGFKPRNIEETIADTVRWLVFIGQFSPAQSKKLRVILPPDPQSQIS